jgi:hypothetical protein
MGHPSFVKIQIIIVSKKLVIVLVGLAQKNNETSQSSNLHFVMVFILRGDRLEEGGKGKMEKSPPRV